MKFHLGRHTLYHFSDALRHCPVVFGGCILQSIRPTINCNLQTIVDCANHLQLSFAIASLALRRSCSTSELLLASVRDVSDMCRTSSSVDQEKSCLFLERFQSMFSGFIGLQIRHLSSFFVPILRRELPAVPLASDKLLPASKVVLWRGEIDLRRLCGPEGLPLPATSAAQSNSLTMIGSINFGLLAMRRATASSPNATICQSLVLGSSPACPLQQGGSVFI